MAISTRKLTSCTDQQLACFPRALRMPSGGNFLPGASVQHIPKLLATAIALASLLATTTAFAQERFVFVNGVRMTGEQISLLELYNCARIPNGSYWLNLFNGAWGYAGNWQVQGYFGDQCNAPGNSQARQRRQSLSERGMLYTPNEILSGR